MRSLMFIALVGLAVPAWAAFDTAEWMWQRPIEAELDEPGFVRVPIDLEIMDESQIALFQEIGVMDFGYQLGNADRFRVNAFHAKHWLDHPYKSLAAINATNPLDQKVDI